MTSSDYPIRKHFKCCLFCTSCIIVICFRVREGIFHTVCSYLPAADEMVQHTQPAWATRGPGMLCQAAGWQLKQNSTFPPLHHLLSIPSMERRVTRHHYGGFSHYKAIPGDTEETRDKFSPLLYPLSQPAKHRGGGTTPALGYHHLGSAPRLNLSRTVPQPELSLQRFCAGGSLNKQSLTKNPHLN